MNGHGIVGHYGVYGLEFRTLLVWIDELVVCPSRDDFSIDFACDFTSCDGDSHADSMWVLPSINGLSDFSTNVEDMGESRSLG